MPGCQVGDDARLSSPLASSSPAETPCSVVWVNVLLAALGYDLADAVPVCDPSLAVHAWLLLLLFDCLTPGDTLTINYLCCWAEIMQGNA